MKRCVSPNTFLCVLSNPKGLRVVTTNNVIRIIQTNGGGDPIVMSGNTKLFKCEECDELYAQEYKLKDHNLMHHSSGYPFECWLCHKV